MTNGNHNTDDPNNAYADEDAAAETRYRKFRNEDPFPNIQPALLNSKDLADYVAATGMIFPFYEKDRKPASYGVRLQGKCIYWDEEGKKNQFILSNSPMNGYDTIEHRVEFTLTRNSIAFVTLEPTIRLPAYIAMRFNLKIRDVYRGLLLGTGPIVDPGFKGKLSFPLHNLTNNDYQYRAGDEIVWMEFTKISESSTWRPDEEDSTHKTRKAKVVPFPSRKLEREDISDYLEHALASGNIRSSIPIEIQQARIAAADSAKTAQAAEESANKMRRIVQIGAFIAVPITIITVAVAAIGTWAEINQLVRDANDLSSTLRADIASLQIRVDRELPDITKASKETEIAIEKVEDRLTHQVQEIEKNTRDVERRVDRVLADITKASKETKIAIEKVEDRLTHRVLEIEKNIRDVGQRVAENSDKFDIQHLEKLSHELRTLKEEIADLKETISNNISQESR